jgi:hypothetical protein
MWFVGRCPPRKGLAPLDPAVDLETRGFSIAAFCGLQGVADTVCFIGVFTSGKVCEVKSAEAP